MDQVLITFGYLIMQYQSLNEDLVARDTIIDSLEMWWKKSEQELFVACVLVNPFYRAEPFSSSSFMNIVGIVSMLTRIWMRLNNTAELPLDEFSAYITDFVRGWGFFQDLTSQIHAELLQAEKVMTLLPLQVACTGILI
jgi:hypothetical protein